MRTTWIISDPPCPEDRTLLGGQRGGQRSHLFDLRFLHWDVRSCCTKGKGVSSQLSVPWVITALRLHSNSLSESAFFLETAIAGATLKGDERDERFHRQPPKPATDYWKHFNLIPKSVTDNRNPIYWGEAVTLRAARTMIVPWGLWEKNPFTSKLDTKACPEGKWHDLDISVNYCEIPTVPKDCMSPINLLWCLTLSIEWFLWVQQV